MTSIFGFLENPQEVYNSVVVVVFDSLGEGEGGEVENIGEGRKSMKEKGGEKRRARKEIVVIFLGGRSAK